MIIWYAEGWALTEAAETDVQTPSKHFVSRDSNGININEVNTHDLTHAQCKDH